MIRKLSAFRRDQRAAVTILVAAGLVMLAGFGAMAVDLGSFFYQKRRQQTANDLAALAAAADLPRAREASNASLRANGFPDAIVESLEHGSYVADPAVEPHLRFRAGPRATADAVRLDVLATTPLLLGRVFALARVSEPARAGSPPAPGTAAPPRLNPVIAAGEVPIRSSAIAVQDRQAAFAVGSRLVRLDGGVLNGLLGALLGANISLSLMDYEALARARIDLFTFSDQLAIRLGLTAVTYDQLVAREARIGDVLAAMQEAARRHPGTTAAAHAALGRIAAAKAGGGERVDLRPLVGFGRHGERQVGAGAPIAASVAVLDLVSATAQLANGTRQVDVALALNIPGIAAASVKLGIGERPAGSTMVAVGSAGASVHTAQTRLLLTVDLIGGGQAALVRLPLYLELASATARLSQIQCSPGDVATARVTLGVTPAVIDSWIGAVSAADFANMRRAPSPGPATLLNLAGIASVTGRAHVTVTNLGETPVSFSHAEIQRGDKKTTSTTNFTATLLSRLVGDLDLRVNVLGLGLGVPGLGAAVTGVIAGAATPLDQLLATTLSTLGIGLGQADSWVSGVRCGGAVLVN